MPDDRLSMLLHEVDALPASVAPPEQVRRRGKHLRRRRQAAVSTAALAVVAGVAFAATTLVAGGPSTLEPPPVVPATSVPSPLQSPVAPSPAPSVEQSSPPQQDVGTDQSDFGFLRGFGERDGMPTVLVDRATWLTGPEADAEAARRGLESPAEYLIVNDDPLVREYPISPEVVVTWTIPLAPAEVGSDSVETTLAELRRRYAELPYAGEVPFDVELSDGGSVVRLSQRYVP